MRRKQVLVVHDTLTGWGAERTLRRFGEFADAKVFEVSYLLTSAKASRGGDAPGGSAVYFLGAPRIRVNAYTQPINFLLKFARAIPWFVRRRRWFDYVIVANPEECLIAYFARKAFGLRSKLIVYNQIVLDIAPANAFLRLLLRAFIAINRRVDAVICVSQGLCDHLAATHAVKGRMFTLPGCIDRRKIDAQSREKVDEDWLLGDGRKTIIYVGRLSNRQKRVDVLLEAVARLRRAHGVVAFKVILVGDGEDRGFLEQRAKALGLEDQVYFLGYKLNPYKYYAVSDVLVLTSDVEGFGNVIIEAMACGLPVISTDCQTGPAEILGGGAWGVLVPPGDHELLAERISRVLTDEAFRRELGRKSLARAGEFEGIKVFEKFTRICEDIDKSDAARGLV